MPTAPRISTENNLYYYRARIAQVYDGDTVTAQVELGFHITVEIKLRLLGINTPEMRSGTAASKKKAVDARDYLRSLILDKTVLIKSKKDKTEKYGRYLATIYLIGADGQEFNINDDLVTKGFAIPFMTGV